MTQQFHSWEYIWAKLQLKKIHAAHEKGVILLSIFVLL